MKNFNDPHDLPACSAVPQPTVPPRTPLKHKVRTNNQRIEQHLKSIQYAAFSVSPHEILCATNMFLSYAACQRAEGNHF
jgi:hypothetical protein